MNLDFSQGILNDIEERRYGAKVADLAYTENMQELGSKAESLGMKVDYELSDERIKTFVKSDGKPVIAYRGTTVDKNDQLDVWDDAYIYAGKPNWSPRIKYAVDHAERVSQKYGQEPELVGHSLGGAKAMYVSKKRGNRGDVKVYNAWVPPTDITFNPKNLPKNIKFYSVHGDYVSRNTDIWSFTPSVVSGLMNAKEKHGLKYFY